MKPKAALQTHARAVVGELDGPARTRPASFMNVVKILRSLAGLRVALIGPSYRLINPSLGALTTLRGMHLLVFPEDRSLTTRLALTGTWELPVEHLLRSCLRPGDHAAEAGANVGYHTLIMAERIGPTGHLHSFEAVEDFHRLLTMNVHFNEMSKWVTLHQAALLDREGEVELLQQPLFRGSAHVPGGFENPGYSRRIRSRATTLDEVLRDAPPLNLLRMDIEGSEILALRGARETIARSPRLRIIMEWQPIMAQWHGDPLAEIQALFNQGFSAWRIEAKGGWRNRYRLDPVAVQDLPRSSQCELLLSRLPPA